MRGVQIRQEFILEGGVLTNGTWDTATSSWKNTGIVDGTKGYKYYVDLTKDFNAKTQSTTDYLLPKFSDTAKQAQDPNFVSGAIFANSYEFYTFG